MAIKIEQIKANGIPLKGDDIDTDRIIPARFLKCITFDGLGDHVFEDDRIECKNNGITHPFDEEKFKFGKILFVNKNFGCGSSREHAPQAIQKWGIKAIIGESFAEIFFGNCISLGIPCLTLSETLVSKVQNFTSKNPETLFEIDLNNLSLSYNDVKLNLFLKDSVRDQFLSGGWDVTGILLDNEEKIHEVADKLPYLKW